MEQECSEVIAGSRVTGIANVLHRRKRPSDHQSDASVRAAAVMSATGYLSSAYRLYAAFVRFNARSRHDGSVLSIESADSVCAHTLPSNTVDGLVPHKSTTSRVPGSSADLQTFKEESLESGFHSSGHFEYESSSSSPPTVNTPKMYKFEELDISVLFNASSLRQFAYEQMRAAGGRHRLLGVMEAGELGSDELNTALSTASAAEKGILLFWATCLGRAALLPLLLEAGADPNYHESFGLSPLHIAAFNGSVECASLLLTGGADPDFAPRCLAPLHCAAFGNSVKVARLLISHGASVHTAEHISSGDNGLLQCAVRAGSVKCLELFVSHGVNVDSIESGGINAIHLAADLGMARCLKVLLAMPGADLNVRNQVGDRKSTALHLAADGGFIECVDLLLERGADASLEDHRGFTALHLAARASCLRCVELLLCKGKANPNATDVDKRTPLHAAIGKTDSVCDIIEMLITRGAKVNQRDEYGFTPLHLAALDGLSHCVETLIVHDADVTARSNTAISALNVIAKKTPSSLATITRKLDCAITLHHSQCGSREVVLKLDFRNILRHHYPHEISYLNAFVDEDQKEFSFSLST
ncbi:Transient receptor potential channel pyrexia [Eumeta japonica]|uniref:Transient receptor potential channel pyrexia n=1 Tax=Eumeta variegata TaxID=151549 RepID=A0A4C2AC58_EUMVA|nr:Transient receptor potential channel pyrexia [Eumeta japonica]